jgi:hypothetical protein
VTFQNNDHTLVIKQWKKKRGGWQGKKGVWQKVQNCGKKVKLFGEEKMYHFS